MKDMQARLEKLRTEAAECALIRDLATDPKKRDLFSRLADHLASLARDVEAAIADAKRVQVSSRWLIAAGRANSRIRYHCRMALSSGCLRKPSQERAGSAAVDGNLLGPPLEMRDGFGGHKSRTLETQARSY
jgi:hypothetical protein